MAEQSNRIHIKFEWHDLWFGVFIGEEAVYVCLIPCFPIIFPRAYQEQRDD